ncbi:MAG: hypothetical protein AVDCRST_MAG39-705, partial [uncultured Sphingomonadaceae bacterium]
GAARRPPRPAAPGRRAAVLRRPVLPVRDRRLPLALRLRRAAPGATRRAGPSPARHGAEAHAADPAPRRADLVYRRLAARAHALAGRRTGRLPPPQL